MPTAPTTPTLKDVIETVARADGCIHLLGAQQSLKALKSDRAHPPLFPPEHHANFELAICFSGEMSIAAHSTTIHLRKGDAVLVKPGAWHYESYFRKNQPYRVCWVMPTQEFVRCLFTRYQPGSFSLAAYGRSPQLDEAAALKNLAREAEGQAMYWQIKARALLLELLVDFHRRLQGDLSVPLTEELDPVRKLLRIVQARFRESLQIPSLAKEVGLSAGRLSRRFRSTLGVTFKQYLNEIRTHHAQCLLQSGWSVKRTADECGFHDVYYFGRVFKQICHVSPGQFAKGTRASP